jgi:hypothetical protein
MGENTDCVEVADLGYTVGLRDSKDPDGPRLIISPHAFDRFVTRLKANE